MADETKNNSVSEDKEYSAKELIELKKWLFLEQNRIREEKAEQKRIYDKFIEERKAFNEDMKRLNSSMLAERKRLREETAFFDKKLSILQNGFMQLDLDRKRFEREKREYENQKFRQFSGHRGYSSYEDVDMGLFFKGVSNPLALRKRYRDLLKIFHPDNMCGDESIVKAINDEYERLKKEEIG